MRLFLDTEFNGFKGDLLSIALVDEVGGEFYARAPEPRFYDMWVFDNVFPKMNHEPVTPLLDIRAGLSAFLRGYTRPEVVCDWPSDPFYLFGLLLGPDHRSTHFQPLTVVISDFEGQFFTSKVPHHALWDARAMRDSFLEANALAAAAEPAVDSSLIP